MRVRSFDLHKAFRADGLITTPSFVQVGRVIEKANRTFRGILVEEDLKALTIDIRVSGELCLLGGHFGL
jgi:hypothetical protein